MADDMDRSPGYTAGYDRDYDRTGSGTGNGEHWLAWLFALLAVGLGALGLLAGFGVFGGGDAIGDAAAQATPDDAANLVNWQDGWLWMLAGISSGLLAFGLHQSDHHQRTRMSKADKGMFGAEHLIAYLFALGAVGAGVLGLMAGWDVWDRGTTFEDGMLWLGASSLCSLLTAGFHAVRHHAYAEDEEFVAHIVERRVGMMERPVEGSATRVRREEPNKF